jgi:hypothetical protein
VQDDIDVFAVLVQELAVEDRLVLDCGLGFDDLELFEALDHGSPPFCGSKTDAIHLELGMTIKALEFRENSGPYSK